MTAPLYCLLAYAMWTLSVVWFGVGVWRVSQVLRGKARPGSFPAEVPHGPDWYRRVLRAHMNCVENLPVFGAVVLTGAVTGFSNPTFDLLAQIVLGARICQTLAHISSGRGLVINVRFTFFLIQLVSIAVMAGLVARQ